MGFLVMRSTGCLTLSYCADWTVSSRLKVPRLCRLVLSQSAQAWPALLLNLLSTIGAEHCSLAFVLRAKDISVEPIDGLPLLALGLESCCIEAV